MQSRLIPVGKTRERKQFSRQLNILCSHFAEQAFLAEGVGEYKTSPQEPMTS